MFRFILFSILRFWFSLFVSVASFPSFHWIPVKSLFLPLSLQRRPSSLLCWLAQSNIPLPLWPPSVIQRSLRKTTSSISFLFFSSRGITNYSFCAAGGLSRPPCFCSDPDYPVNALDNVTSFANIGLNESSLGYLARVPLRVLACLWMIVEPWWELMMFEPLSLAVSQTLQVFVDNFSEYVEKS